jgi:perosamine synthetase
LDRASSGTVIPITKPLVGEAEGEAARAVVLSGWLAQGPQVKAFEREFAAFVGAAHACAVASCTAALALALRAVGVGPGDEVVTVSQSFIAAANCVRACGAEPVFVDVIADTYNLDPAGLAHAITPRTKAILCVHQIGMPCDLSRILAAARAHRIPVIEDAACAIGSEILIDGHWQRIGKPHADIACFSFHASKVITTGEGGMLTTANPDYDRMFRMWRQHGMDIASDVRHGAPNVIFESYAVEGFNYRMTDLQAAIGRKQLERLPGILERRRSLAARYRTLFGNSSAVGLPREPAWARSNWQRYCVRLPDHVEQRAVMQALRDRGIATNRGIMCAHREAPYAMSPHRPLPQSEAGQDRSLLIPLYPQMSDEQQEQIVAAVKDVCGR